MIFNQSASFTRPANTTQYTSGDLVANNTSAGSVAPMEFSLAPAGGGAVSVTRVRLSKTGTSATSAAFRLHLFSQSPTVTNGDNGAFETNKAAAYLGALDVTAMVAASDGAFGNGAPLVGTALDLQIPGPTVYGLLEARGTYTPASAEVITATIEARKG